jgi:hypothetical protein
MTEPERLFQPRNLIAVLESHGVRYVLIGGFAALVQGSGLVTNDADVCPARDEDNLERLAATLAELDARIATVDDPRGADFPHEPEFIGRVETWNLVTRYGRFDIWFRPSGTEGYEDLRRRAIDFDLGEGLVVPVASLVDIIRSKEAAGRDKDRRALPILRQLLERIDEKERES